MLFHRITARGTQFTQQVGYDGQNRLTLAQENPAAPAWTSIYTYDNYGNRAESSTAYLLAALTPQSLTEYDASTNRWMGGSSSYDAAGNQQAGLSGSFAYDGEGRMTFSNMYGANQIWYAYDGDGRRVGKFELLVLSPTSTDFRSTIYARDAFGNTVAEYCSPDCAYGSLGTTYYTTDVLGSTRVETDAGGNVKRRYDYLPFGQEIPAQWPAAVGTRTVGMRYQLSASTDAMPAAKFTGKERDAETGLDFFESRYYSSAQGRFTSPDEFKGGFLDAFSGQSAFQAGPLPYADITDPQTLNKYAYVRNNPLRYTDPNAHCLEDACVVEAILGYTAATAVAGGVIYYAQRLGTAIGEFFNAKKSEREVTPPANSNKPGTRGKEDHQQTANEEADRVNGEREVRIPTPGGKKDTRVADAAGTNPQTG